MTARTTRQANRFLKRAHKTKTYVLMIAFGITTAYAAVCCIYTTHSIMGYFSDRLFNFQNPISISIKSPISVIKRADLKPGYQSPATIPENAHNSPKEASGGAKMAPNKEATSTGKLETILDNAYDTVWFHESTRGTNKKEGSLNADCIKLGMINEIGFAPGQGICFKDRTEQEATFKLWVNNRLGLNCVKKGYCRATIEELLSLYSTNAYSSLLAEK